MAAIRFFLIIVILLISSFIMYLLLKERATLIGSSRTPVIEGMKELKDIKEDIRRLFSKTPAITIENINKKRTNLPLREYCIKASYNSAYTGSKISEEMVKYILSRGCRFLDLQIFLSENDNIPYVAYITDPTSKEMESSNKVSLDTILNTIATNAFSTLQGNTGSPNPKDPLFIHFRIIPDKNKLVYDKVANYIEKNFPRNLRFIDNTGNAALLNPNMQIEQNDKSENVYRTILGKTIFLLDKNNQPDYALFSQKMANVINGETGGSTFQVQDYGKMINQTKMPPTVNDNFRNTNITSENIVMPEILEKYPNPNIMDMVVDYGIQITMYPFYKYSDEVIQYELLFNEYKTAFVPMAYAIKYLERMRTDLAAKNMQLGAL